YITRAAGHALSKKPNSAPTLGYVRPAIPTVVARQMAFTPPSVPASHHHRGRCFHHYFTKPQTAFTIVTDCADPLPTFAILSGSGTPKDTGFAQVAYPAVGSTTVGFFGTSLSEGSIFSLNAAGKLLAGAEVADVKPGNSLRSSISMPLW
ncbi:hypothetical protein MMC08_003729, partial [Hypocenomyce scalaris]|nr:hypothetical protein [Hypocenomyce scalaris]